LLNKKELRHIGISCLNFNLKKAARETGIIYDRIFQPLGIKSTQFSILVGVAFFTESSMKELSEMLGLDRTTLTKNLKPLLRDGYLRITQGEDRRRQLVSLTKKGENLLAEAIPLRNKMHEILVSKLGKKDYHTLISSLHHFDKTIKGKKNHEEKSTTKQV
jgi:DNA-binding MarR family transcriptional regulator